VGIFKEEKNMKKEEFAITKDKLQGGITRYTAKGRVNSINAPKLKYMLEEAIDDEQIDIVLNMSQVEYLSSIGISAILSVYKQAEEAGSIFRIEQPSEVVRNVLGITALDKMLMV
jgi:anti-sigma B factor antagonist